MPSPNVEFFDLIEHKDATGALAALLSAFTDSC